MEDGPAPHHRLVPQAGGPAREDPRHGRRRLHRLARGGRLPRRRATTSRWWTTSPPATARWINPRARLHVVDLRSARLAERVRGRAAGGGGPPRRAGVGGPLGDAIPRFDASVNVHGRRQSARVLPALRRHAGHLLVERRRRLRRHRRHPHAGEPPSAADLALRHHARSRWSTTCRRWSAHLRHQRRSRSATPTSTGRARTRRARPGVVAIFCHRLLTGQAPMINGDGRQTRDYTYVEDVAAANLAALERPRGHRARSTSAPASRRR